MHYIGIDLGTSACKFLLTDEKGNILNIVSEEYPLEFPQPGWSQQEPADWWKAVKLGMCGNSHTGSCRGGGTSGKC